MAIRSNKSGRSSRAIFQALWSCQNASSVVNRHLAYAILAMDQRCPTSYLNPTNGLLRFSSPTVVGGPCAGNIVLSGSEKSFSCVECTNSSNSSSGKSVRPTLPLNQIGNRHELCIRQRVQYVLRLQTGSMTMQSVLSSIHTMYVFSSKGCETTVSHLNIRLITHVPHIVIKIEVWKRIFGFSQLLE